MGFHVLSLRQLPSRAARCLALALLAVVALAASTDEAARRPPEPLVFVVHRSNPTDNLTLADLRKLFHGERRKWSHGRNVTLVMRNPGTIERDTVLRELYEMDENEFARFFLHAEFVGDVATPPKQLNSAQGVIRFVFNVPGAIGYVRLSELDKSVKPLRIGGLAPGDPGYPLIAAKDLLTEVSSHAGN